jgi:hypothetical protein
MKSVEPVDAKERSELKNLAYSKILDVLQHGSGIGIDSKSARLLQFLLAVST